VAKGLDHGGGDVISTHEARVVRHERPAAVIAGKSRVVDHMTRLAQLEEQLIHDIGTIGIVERDGFGPRGSTGAIARVRI